MAALKWLHDAIYVNKIAPQAVTGWQEGNVQQEFTAGHAAFAINYPFVASVDASTKSSPAYKHTGYIPFPAAKGGRPGSALGGEMLAINAKTANVAAVWKLIQYLTSPSVETKRAIATGDPPSLPSAYTSALYAKAPYFKQVKVLNGYAQPRPVSPKYLQISVDLQNAFSAVFANTSSPALGDEERGVADPARQTASTRRATAAMATEAPALRAGGRRRPPASGRVQGGSPARLPHGRAGDRPAARGHRLPACVQPVELVPRREPERGQRARAAGSGSTTTPGCSSRPSGCTRCCARSRSPASRSRSRRCWRSVSR